MTITGELLIGSTRVSTKETFTAFNPATGEALSPGFSAATPEHVETACALAQAAFDSYRETDLETRAKFLETIADNILKLGDELLERASAESGLPRARLEGERGRTMNQLRLFAQVVRAGDWLGVRFDSALPDRAPAPRPDMRLRKIGIGPVVVFGASNFPLAFSVAGGDTASALAAGCPVIVKAHSAHPGTSALVGRAVADAVKQCGLHEGVFSMLTGNSHALGGALISDHRVKAVGFTGSRGGGTTFMKIAASRPEPIPVYAEMSSINPVILLPNALESRAEALGAGFTASLTMGAGQFCTNPGLVIALAGPALDRFAKAAADAVGKCAPAVMLTQRIYEAYVSGVEKLGGHAKVRVITAGGASGETNRGRAALFMVDAPSFVAHEELAEEVFGSSSLIVSCANEDEFIAVLNKLEGQLTATLHLDAADHALAKRLLPTLERKAGRIIANGWPTGVEVSHAMVHGGPFPATSDGRSTSVGSLAIERFLRPVCYQDMPEALLPAALKQDNPLRLTRLVDGAVRLA